MNKLRLWLSRNNFRILLIITVSFVCYSMIKSGNNYFKNKNLTNNDEIDENIETNIEDYNSTDIDDKIVEKNKFEKNKLIKIKENSNEYKKVNQITQIIIKYFYKAYLDENNIVLKNDIYNIFSNEQIEELSEKWGKVTEDNILDYIFVVDNPDYYYVGNVYRYKEDNSNNISRYFIDLKFDNGGAAIIGRYVIINVDNNNRTFSYSGTTMNLELFEGFSELTEIKNKGSNIF